jgi:hypothetical protein
MKGKACQGDFFTVIVVFFADYLTFFSRVSACASLFYHVYQPDRAFTQLYSMKMFPDQNLLQ